MKILAHKMYALPSQYWWGEFFSIEIKISRSDFKADFKKNKHIIHESNGKKYYTEKGSLVKSSNPDWDFCRNFPELIECRDYTDPYSFRYNKRQMITLYYSAMSSVNFREFKNEKLPNKFFYAVPKGLISKDEVPDYAGLLYVDENLNIEKVKDGKFIHKDILDKNKLWNKTYYAYERELASKLKEVELLKAKAWKIIVDNVSQLHVCCVKVQNYLSV